MSPEATVYLDYNATAPLRPGVLAAMQEELGRGANPSSQHAPGRRARQALTRARRTIASGLCLERDAVVFTASGSEANLLALAGAVRALPATRRRVLTTAIEHPSVLETLRALQQRGELQLEVLPVDRDGRISLAALRRARGPQVGLASVMLASNEIGTIQPIAAVRNVLGNEVVLHCDAVQAVGKIPVDLRGLGADLVTLSAHKFGGPHGAGALLRVREVALETPLSAGRQEAGLRGGTENVAACVGAAVALEQALGRLADEQALLQDLRGELLAELRRRFSDVVFHSPEDQVLPGTVCLSLPQVPGSWLVAALDRRGFAISHGSACASLASVPSPVLAAIGAGELSHCAIRVSFGHATRRQDLLRFAAALERCARRVRDAKFFLASQDSRARRDAGHATRDG